MKICERALNFWFVDSPDGNIGICGWTKIHSVGKLTENSLDEIYNNEKSRAFRDRQLCGDYSDCFVDGCPYLSANEVDKFSVEYKEQRYPEWLSIAFEHCCNYSCRCCGIKQTNGQVYRDLEKDYDIVASELKKVMPHIKRVYSNGCGELFVSKRSMKLLQEWEPLKPDEAEVYIESNGSLFNKDNWEKIENVGRFNLTVAITVMSFDEEIYQFLSGTKLPISQVENNLRFIKSLRDKGIVNRFEIATVVQEQNFREMPEFARRCVEEFGADYVRLRPYQAWGDEPKEQAWITDVRNPEHPYNQEYRRVMSHPIFSHPKVHDWSGGRDTALPVIFPYKDEFYKERIITDMVMNSDELVKNIKGINKNIYIYGLGCVGKVLAKELKNHGIEIKGIIDKNPQEKVFLGVLVDGIEVLNSIDEDAVIIVTPIIRIREILKQLSVFKLLEVKSIKDYIHDKHLYEEVIKL